MRKHGKFCIQMLAKYIFYSFLFDNRQARVLFTNIRLHPDEYTPMPPKVALKVYTFYHKEDQPMLFPIKRVSYNDNFYRGNYSS